MKLICEHVEFFTSAPTSYVTGFLKAVWCKVKFATDHWHFSGELWSFELGIAQAAKQQFMQL
jgi:hypothetical protein